MEATAAAARRRRWVKEWVPQELVVAGGTCALYKWVREDQLAALKEKDREQEAEEIKAEPSTEVLFLCSYAGCGKTFIDAGALRKHAHVHGERQFVCHFDGCGKKFLDSSKLKRHFLIHTGEKNYICPHEGCGKAFSLDFNLKAHMKTHLPENYHVCPYLECGRRFTQESKLRGHIKAQHEKNTGVSTITTAQADHLHSAPKASAAPQIASAERPYACPYASCSKAYIHEYKLNLHLKKEHPGHFQEGSTQPAAAKGSTPKNSQRSKPSLAAKVPPVKVPKRRGFTTPSSAVTAVEDHQWPRKALYEDDSEETEEEGDNNIEEGWRYKEASSDDEETEDED